MPENREAVIISAARTPTGKLQKRLLRDPYWPLHAAADLGHPADWPSQYLRAAPPDARPREER